MSPKIRKTSRLNFLSSIPKFYIGNFLDYRGADINYAKIIEIDYCRSYPLIEFDGDIKGYLPAKIEVLHKSLEVIVPETQIITGGDNKEGCKEGY